MSNLGTMVTLDEYLATAHDPDYDFVNGSLEKRHVGEWDHGTLQLKIGAYFLARYESLGMRVVPERILVSADRVGIPDLCLFLKDPNQRVPTTPPFLCIEILSPEDRMSRIEVRINDYLDPETARRMWPLGPRA